MPAFGPEERSRFNTQAADLEPKAVREALFDLLRFAEDNASELGAGTGETASFHYRVAFQGEPKTLLSVGADGYVSIHFRNFRTWLNQPTMRLKRKLEELPGFDNLRRYQDKPGFYIATSLIDPAVAKKFERALLKYQVEIEA